MPGAPPLLGHRRSTCPPARLIPEQNIVTEDDPGDAPSGSGAAPSVQSPGGSGRPPSRCMSTAAMRALPSSADLGGAGSSEAVAVEAGQEAAPARRGALSVHFEDEKPQQGRQEGPAG
jgi:hypothetical protein